MKQFIYRAAAFLFLLNTEAEPNFTLKENDFWGDEDLNDHLSKISFCMSLAQYLDGAINCYIGSWWDVITSPAVDPFTAPWSGNEHAVWHTTNRDLGYPINTMSPHHREWRRSKNKE